MLSIFVVFSDYLEDFTQNKIKCNYNISVSQLELKNTHTDTKLDSLIQ